MVILALTAWFAAFAQEDTDIGEVPVAPTVEDPAEPQPQLVDAEGHPVSAPTVPSAEVIVYGDAMVERARQKFISEAADLGYTKQIRRGDYVILRNEQAWKGDLILHDDGWVRLKRQPLRIQSRDLPWADEGSPLAWASCAVYPPMCIRSGGATLGRAKWRGVQDRTMETVKDEAVVLGDRVADRETEEVINSLPERLEALWVMGIPLADGPVLSTTEERKKELLDYWESRTDTVWGDRVRMGIEGFIKAEIQTSETPLTQAEIDAFNERRHSETDLDLNRDWEAWRLEQERLKL